MNSNLLMSRAHLVRERRGQGQPLHLRPCRRRAQASQEEHHDAAGALNDLPDSVDPIAASARTATARTRWLSGFHAWR